MKKSFFFAALMMVAAMFTACNSAGTPQDDTTNLWPAYDAKGEHVGYINANGEMAISAMYDNANQFSCGYGRVGLAGNYFFLNKSGEAAQGTPDLSDGCDPYFYYNCLGYRVNGKWGMCDKSFKTFIQPAYSFIGYMSESGLVCFRMGEDDKYGFLNKKGEIAIQAIYDDANWFKDGVATVKVGEKWGAIGTDGQFAINATYDDLWSIGEGRLVFVDHKAQKGGMMDTKGNVIVQPIYDGVENFADNGLCPVCQNEKWGYINKNGDIKLAIMYHEAAPFYEGYAWIYRTEDSNAELIDTNGNNVLTLSENESPYGVFHNGLCKVIAYNDKDGSRTYKYIDKKGTLVYSWTVKGYDAPARVKGTKKMDLAEMFAGTPYGPMFNNKK